MSRVHSAERLMKIKVLTELKTKSLPSLYCSPLVPVESEEEAVSWAERKGADVLYRYDRHGQSLYLVEVHP